MMIFICEKVRLQQLIKAKYSILASICTFFFFFFLTEPYIYLRNTLCNSHGFLISCFESGNMFQEMLLLAKFHFVIPFWIRSILQGIFFAWIDNCCLLFIFVVILFCSTTSLVVIDFVTISGNTLQFVTISSYFFMLPLVFEVPSLVIWLALISINPFHLHSICVCLCFWSPFIHVLIPALLYLLKFCFCSHAFTFIHPCAVCIFPFILVRLCFTLCSLKFYLCSLVFPCVYSTFLHLFWLEFTCILIPLCITLL